MREIKIYGTQSSNYQYLKYALKKWISKAGIKANLIEVNNIDDIIGEGIDCIPAVKINNSTIIPYKGDSNINNYLKSLLQTILKEYNFGNMKRILVPIDFSNPSLNALIYAKKLALDINASITIAHYYHPTLENSEIDHQKEIMSKLNSLAETNSYTSERELYAPIIDTKAQEGFPGDLINHDSDDYHLIIMGTKGTHIGIHKWIGSISQSVVKKSKCPVILVPPSATYSGIENIYYPVENKMRRFDKVKWLLRSLKPVIHVTHYDMNVLHSPMIKEILAEQTKLLMSNNEWNLKYSSIETEDVAVSITEYLESNEIDLLILEKGRETISDVFFQTSVTNKLTGNLKSPILVLTENQKCRGCDGLCCDAIDKSKNQSQSETKPNASIVS